MNLDLIYDNFETGTGAGLYYNIFGRRLSEVSLGGAPNVFEEPRSTLDFTLTRSLGAWYSLKLTARNLLDSAYRFAFWLDLTQGDGLDRPAIFCRSSTKGVETWPTS